MMTRLQPHWPSTTWRQLRICRTCWTTTMTTAAARIAGRSRSSRCNATGGSRCQRPPVTPSTSVRRCERCRAVRSCWSVLAPRAVRSRSMGVVVSSCRAGCVAQRSLRAPCWWEPVRCATSSRSCCSLRRGCSPASPTRWWGSGDGPLAASSGADGRSRPARRDHRRPARRSQDTRRGMRQRPSPSTSKRSRRPSRPAPQRRTERTGAWPLPGSVTVPSLRSPWTTVRRSSRRPSGARRAAACRAMAGRRARTA